MNCFLCNWLSAASCARIRLERSWMACRMVVFESGSGLEVMGGILRISASEFDVAASICCTEISFDLVLGSLKTSEGCSILVLTRLDSRRVMSEMPEVQVVASSRSKPGRESLVIASVWLEFVLFRALEKEISSFWELVRGSL